MKVELIRESPHGDIGQVLSGFDVWRLCFPVSGCVARPVDAKAVARVRQDLETTDEHTRKTVLYQMRCAGTSPYSDETGETPIDPAAPAIVVEPLPAPVPAPEPAPVSAVVVDTTPPPDNAGELIIGTPVLS